MNPYMFRIQVECLMATGIYGTKFSFSAQGTEPSTLTEQIFVVTEVKTGG